MLEGHIPYGYRIEMGTMVIDEDTGEIVKRIFAEYCEGIPQYKLKETIEEFAISIGANKLTMSKQSISDILRNRKYLGDGIVPKLIDEDTFEQAQKIRKQRLKKLGKDNPYNTLETAKQQMFSSKIICGECGEIYNKYKRKAGRTGKKVVWDCSHHIVNGKIACKNVDLTDEQLMCSFISIVNRIKNNELLMKENKKRIVRKESARFKSLDAEIKKVENFEKEYNTDEMIRMILKRAVLKYENTTVDYYDYYTEKIKGLFSGMKMLTEFDEKFFKALIKNIVIFKDDKVKFILINGVEIEDKIIRT